MQHAYLFMANANFSVISACMRMLDSPSGDFFFIFDKKTFKNRKEASAVLPNLKYSKVYILEPMIINWGSYSFMIAILKLIRAAVETKKYDYYHTFQGADLPIKKQKDINAFFEKNNGTEFIQIWKDQSRVEWGKERCQYRWFLSHNRWYRNNKLIKIVNFALYRLQKMFHVKVNQDIEIYFGSSLFSITNDFACYLLSREVEIKKRFRWALCADEHFVQVIAMDSPFRGKIAKYEDGAHARLIDWNREPRQKGSPYVWRISDYDYICSAPEHMCFSRKFLENTDNDIIKALELRFKD